MTDWYLAASLVALRSEINARWPGRDKRSDGAKGDDAHASRVSDHNPDWSAGGVVRAVDVDKDGLDLAELLAAVIGDPRVAYVIHNGQMWRSYTKTIGETTYKPWQPAPYDGPNPHTGHVHVSIRHNRMAETDTSSWLGRIKEEEDDYMSSTEGKAQLDRIEKALAGLAAAEAARYSDIARRVQAGNDEERGRYKYYAAKFGAILTELEEDPASPVTAQ